MGINETFGVECAHCGWRSHGTMEQAEAQAEAHVTDCWHVVLMRVDGILAGGWTPHTSMTPVFESNKLELARLIQGNDERFYENQTERAFALVEEA